MARLYDHAATSPASVVSGALSARTQGHPCRFIENLIDSAVMLCTTFCVPGIIEVRECIWRDNDQPTEISRSSYAASDGEAFLVLYGV